MNSWNEIRKAAMAFSKRWKTAFDEKSQAQSFLKDAILAAAAAMVVAVTSARAADRQLYGATFEGAVVTNTGSMNDFAYVVGDYFDGAWYNLGENVSRYSGVDGGGPFGWFVGCEDDESMIVRRADAEGGQALRLNTEAETLTNRLHAATATAFRSAAAAEGAYLETDVKFTPQDMLDTTLVGGADESMFAIYAYCEDYYDNSPTNLVVFHAYRDDNGNVQYTNEVFGVHVDVRAFMRLRMEIRQADNGGTPFNLFSVSLNGTPLTSTSAYEDDRWFLTTERPSSRARRAIVAKRSGKRLVIIVHMGTVISLSGFDAIHFRGTGEIDNISIGAIERDDHVVIEGVPLPKAWISENAAEILAAHGGDHEATAMATAANGVNKVWECYVAGLCPTNAADKFIATINVDADGAPEIGWEPRLSAADEAKRTYTVEGKAKLTDDVWTPTNPASRFFRVKVTMP